MDRSSDTGRTVVSATMAGGGRITVPVDSARIHDVLGEDR